MDIKRTVVNFLKRNGIALVGAIVGLSILQDTTDAIAIARVIGIVSTLLLVVSFVFDERSGKGLFSSYDEEALMKVAAESPIASALVIVVKNLLTLGIIAMGLLFCLPR